MIATALTFLKNFSVPCMWVAVAAGLAGASGGAWVAKRFTESRAVRAESALAAYQAAVATQTAQAVQTATDRQRAIWAELRSRDESVTAAVDSIPARVAAMLAPRFTELRSTIDAPQYDCLREPYPDDGLRLLRRPGGTVPAAGD